MAEFVKLCPICGNKKFNVFKGNKALEAASNELQKCERCKNVFAFPIELPKKQADKIKLVPLNKDIKSDTPKEAYISVGKFEVGFYWKILSIIFLILGIGFFYLSTQTMICSTVDTGEIICNANTTPTLFLIYGLAALFGSLYLFIESVVIFRHKHAPARAMRFLLFIALLAIIFFLGRPVLFFLP